ncbi:MAG TPA: glutamyl-tRNA amidotransferase [Cytophagales bacterium]|nr:glutamyl-tRNA amidotransferase [Cytophagales bacterium]
MSLKAQIEADIKKAMLAKDKDRLRALRSIKSAIMLAETEKGGEAELSAATEMKILQKAAKQRRDSMALYKEQGRDDLASAEEDELKVIHEYLPKQMSEAELEAAVNKIITDLGASSMKDMGKVMGIATKTLAGKADGKAISEKVKALLS